MVAVAARDVTPITAELADADAALEAWARWAKSALREIGWPPVTLLARVIEYGVYGAAQKAGIRVTEVSEACELVDRAVSRLSEPERQVVAYHYMEWAPIKDQARQLRMSPERFRNLLHKARRSVSDFLDGAALRYNAS